MKREDTPKNVRAHISLSKVQVAEKQTAFNLTRVVDIDSFVTFMTRRTADANCMA